MSSSPVLEPSSPPTTPSSPPLKPPDYQFQTSTPNYVLKKQQQQPPLSVTLPSAPSTPPACASSAEPTLTPPPRSPGAAGSPAGAGDGKGVAPDGTSSDKSSETAVGTVTRTTSSVLSRKESYKAQRQHYRREKKRATSALLHSIEDPSVVVLADWLKVRGSLKSWTKLWCVLKPGLLLLYKSPKAKSSHWVGTVLLTSCQVIERPSKKDGFCFKLYHPLEQSIWAPRGPHNETIGAVVQPLPTAHLIFRAPSQAAGHCWLDGLELALRCSNAMLRCSRSRPEKTISVQEPATETNLSHEELEKHFNEHECSGTPTPLMSVSDYSPKRCSSSERRVKYQIPKKTKQKQKSSKWAQFMESIDRTSKDHSSSDSSEKKDTGFLDFIRKKELAFFDRSTASTSSMRIITQPKLKRQTSKSLASSPLKVDPNKRTPILKCFEIPKLPITLADKKIEKEKTVRPTNLLEDNLIRFMSTFPKRRSSTPSTLKNPFQKRISELRESGVKTDSENDDVFLKNKKKQYHGGSEVICNIDDIIITKTAPSNERVRRYSSSSTDEVGSECVLRQSPQFNFMHPYKQDKFSLINYEKLPSASLKALKTERNEERMSSQNVYVAGKIVRTELAGAASDTDSEGMPEEGQLELVNKQKILERLELLYVEDPNKELGKAGELVEEVAEENKSLLWFLLKQVRPGMDLSKVVLPTFILEPRSFLDKLSDSYYHSDMLAQAQYIEDPYERFKCVLRWYLSGLYRKPKGLKKPYNPVLGEVFRCCWRHPDSNDNYTFYIAEQVSHHPPISAFYVSNRKEGYVIEGSLLARSKFYGNSTSAILEGSAKVTLLNWNESYIFTAPYAHCKGIVIGTLSMELGGKVNVICSTTGYQADVEFKLRSFLGGADQTNSISGRIKCGKDTVATLDGYWDGKIDIKDKRSGDATNLLEVAVLKNRRMPRYLIDLKMQRDYESEKLWMKVSEAIYNEDQVAATEQKTIIEEAQRERARNTVTPWVPRFFHRDAESPLPNGESPLPNGLTDQGWRYNHADRTPWSADDQIEFEDDFVIQTLRAAGARSSMEVRIERTMRASASKTATDSDSLHDLPGHRHKSRYLKRTLEDIDSRLKDQNVAIDRLQRTVDALSDPRTFNPLLRPQNIGRVPSNGNLWHLLAGFAIALIMQAMLNWMSNKPQ